MGASIKDSDMTFLTFENAVLFFLAVYALVLFIGGCKSNDVPVSIAWAAALIILILTLVMHK